MDKDEDVTDDYELDEISKPSDHVKDESFNRTADDGFDGHTRRGRQASFELYTPDEERVVVKKLDRHLVLFVAFLYMLSFLDRSSMPSSTVEGNTKHISNFFQISATRELPASQMTFISALRNMNGC